MAAHKNEKYSRIMYILSYGCTKVTRAYIMKEVRDSSPKDHNPYPWTLDDFLCQNRQNIEGTFYGKRKETREKLFPLIGTTDIESWDLQMLCFIYLLLCNPSYIVEMDYEHFKKIRNKLCHTTNGILLDRDYNIYMRHLTEGIQRCVTGIQDPDLKSEMDEVIKAAETDAALQIELFMETKLKDWHDAEMMALTQIETCVGRVEEGMKHATNVVTQNSEGITRLSEEQQLVIKNVTAIAQALGVKIDIPATKLKVAVTNCESDNEHFLCKKIIEYLEPNIGHLADTTQNEMREAVSKAMEELLGNDITLIGAQQKCIILNLKVQSFDHLKVLWRRCIDGEITTLFEKVEKSARKLHGFEIVKIEVLLTDDEYWRCIAVLVTELRRLYGETQLKTISTPIRTKERVQASIKDVPSPGKGAYIEMSIQSESVEQLDHILNACETGKFNEKLHQLSEVLKSKYKLSNLTIEAELLAEVKEYEKTNEHIGERIDSLHFEVYCELAKDFDQPSLKSPTKEPCWKYALKQDPTLNISENEAVVIGQSSNQGEAFMEKLIDRGYTLENLEAMFKTTGMTTALGHLTENQAKVVPSKKHPVNQQEPVFKQDFTLDAKNLFIAKERNAKDIHVKITPTSLTTQSKTNRAKSESSTVSKDTTETMLNPARLAVFSNINEKKGTTNHFMGLLRDTPAITSQTAWPEARPQVEGDPRFKAVNNELLRERWFNEYITNLLKNDFMRLLRETPKIKSTSTWTDARERVDKDKRFQAVNIKPLLEQWFDEFISNLNDFMGLLRDTPAINGQTAWPEARPQVEGDPRFQAVNNELLRERWFTEYITNLNDFMGLLRDTPAINGQTAWPEARPQVEGDPRFKAVNNELLRERWFTEYITNLMNFMRLLRNTPTINSSQSAWPEARPQVEGDPRFQAVNNELLRERWFNEYITNLLKNDFMRLLRETLKIKSTSTWTDARERVDKDKRFQAVNIKPLLEQWFDEFISNLNDFMGLLRDTPAINGQTAWRVARQQLEGDPRFQAVNSERLRMQWFIEYQINLNDFMGLLRDTPAINGQTAWPEARPQVEGDPRFKAVNNELLRERWFTEYITNLLKNDFMRLLRETLKIKSTSTWTDARERVDKDKRFQAVNIKPLLEQWFDEFISNLLKENYMQLLLETPEITGQLSLDKVKDTLKHDYRYNDVASDERREEWFNEYFDLRNDFMRLLCNTRPIHSQSAWPEARKQVDKDLRFQNVNNELLRERWFTEYITNLKNFMRLLRNTPTINSQSAWPEARPQVEGDPRFQAVNNELLRERWFNEYITNLLNNDFMRLLRETLKIKSTSTWTDARERVDKDKRFQAVNIKPLLEQWFDEFISNKVY